MWLEYALNEEDNLVSVNDCPRGKSNLRCPYCQGELIAKKGKIKAHHFAHLGQTCQYVEKAEDPGLPLYNRFDFGLKKKYLKVLHESWNKSSCKNPIILMYGDYFEKLRLAKANDFRQAYEFTNLGKIIVGGLSLNLFNRIQESRLRENLEARESRIVNPKRYEVSLEQLRKSIEERDPKILERDPGYLEKEYKRKKKQQEEYQNRITDYKIYRQQYRYILRNRLYFLEIQADNQVFYKIGLTSRTLAERIPEIEYDLKQHFNNVSIKGLGFWEHRGNVEYYFKYRYRQFNYPIGSLTEYFQFDDVKPVLRDLRRMKPKQLSDLERDILENEDVNKQLNSIYIRNGMKNAKFLGFNIGRPSKRELMTDFLKKPKSQQIISVLKKGLSLRATAQKAGVSVNTVRKVKEALSDDFEL